MTAITATLVNGEPGELIPVSDRGLLYGDGIFETIAVREGCPQHWQRHMSRLQAGCTRLGIQPFESAQLAAEADSIIKGADTGVLKLIVTRGSGGRGYRVAETTVSTRIMQLHPWPEYPAVCAEQGVRTRLCETRLGHNPVLAGIKHLNRLEQVLARQEWIDDDIREGLLMDADGNLVEGTMSNLFIVSDGVLMTPDLSRCGVAGIMRTIVLELAEQQGLATRIRQISQQALAQADEVFLSNSLIGIWPVIAIGKSMYRKGKITMQLQKLLADTPDNNPGWRE
jgi:4-amino-4-deoxychorismate lyase